VIEVATLNLREAGHGPIKSITKAGDALAVAIALAICAADHEDGWPDQTEYAAYWRISERSAQREWAQFREAFPDSAGPEQLARYIHAEVGRKLKRNAASAFSLPAPAALAAA
jgi:hypothetical protein